MTEETDECVWNIQNKSDKQGNRRKDGNEESNKEKSRCLGSYKNEQKILTAQTRSVSTPKRLQGCLGPVGKSLQFAISHGCQSVQF